MSVLSLSAASTVAIVGSSLPIRSPQTFNFFSSWSNEVGRCFLLLKKGDVHLWKEMFSKAQSLIEMGVGS